MRSLLVAILFVASPAFATELAPSGEIKRAATGRVHYLGSCASARYLAAALEGGTPALYQLDLAKRSATNLGALPDAHEFAFNSDCSVLALAVTSGRGATQKNEVHLYKLSAKAPVKLGAYGAFKYPVSALAFVDDKTFVVGLNKGPIELWSIEGKSLDTRAIDGGVMSLAFSDGNIAIGTYEGGVYLSPLASAKLGPLVTLAGKAPTRETGSLNVDTGEIVMPGGGRVMAIAFVEGGKRLLASQETGQIASWPIAAGKPGNVEIVATKLDGPNAMAVSTDQKLVVVGENFRVSVWKSTGNKHVTDLGKLDRVEKYASFRGIVFAGPREILVGSSKSSTVRIYRAP